MHIPDRLRKLLDNDANQDLYGGVLQSASRLGKWLKANDVIFFKEYTDHGLPHVQRVLNSAVEILSEESHEVLTGPDAAVLILAVILHDSAMHLSLDGFLMLIDPIRPWPVGADRARFLTAMGDRPWNELWDEFLREASRFDQRKLVALFDQPKPVQRPPDGPHGWKDEDYKLAGEFLRRHHARLAHEIALCGVPGPEGDTLQLADLDPDLKDLAGLIARSHGLALRATVDHLPKGGVRDFRDVHAPLLMAALRIADYLELDASRAPKERLMVRRLRSPVSRQAWDSHGAIRDIKIDEVDHQAVWFDAEPKDLNTLLDLRSLLDGLQQELDGCWAVLGEVYNGDPLYSDPLFGLRLRRVTSTLDDLQMLSNRLEFVPMRASFKAADGDLLKLLVGPLYHDQPAYGIRELMQNAVDACRELDDIRAHQPKRGLFDVENLEADVVVTLHEDAEQASLTVEDRGVGMSPDIIIDYFLRVGASFRASEDWQRRHGDLSTQPRVARAGRFGVGALAAFLLGDEIEVTTRHFDAREDRGVAFKARIDTPTIEMRWCRRRIGTTIKVSIHPDRVLPALGNIESWDWYRLKKPSVLRKIQLNREVRIQRSGEWEDDTVRAGKEIRPAQVEAVPHDCTPPPIPWHRLPGVALCDVLWAHNRGKLPGFEDYCNGFTLKQPNSSRTRVDPLWPPTEQQGDRVWPPTKQQGDLVLIRPRVSVLDPSGVLPIDLRRTKFTDLSSLREPLMKAVCRDILASVLVRMACNREEVLEQIEGSIWKQDNLSGLWHPGITGNPNYLRAQGLGEASASWLFVTDDGVELEDPAQRSQSSPIGICLIASSEYSHRGSRTPSRESLVKSLRRVPTDYAVGYQSGQPFFDVWSKRRERGGYAAMTILVSSNQWNISRRRSSYHNSRTTPIGNGWIAVHDAGMEPFERLVEHFTAMPAADDSFWYGFFLDPPLDQMPAPRNPLSRLWLDLIGPYPIPFDLGLRQRACRRAFDMLHDEVMLWQELMAAPKEKQETSISYWVESDAGGY